MQKQGQLYKPFNQGPPQGPLPKITLYDIPYPIRIKISDENKEKRTPSYKDNNKTSSHSRKGSSSNIREKYLSRRTSLGGWKNQKNQYNNMNQGKIMEHKKKIIFDGLIQSLNNSAEFRVGNDDECSLWQLKTKNFKNSNNFPSFSQNNGQNMQTMKTQYLLTSLDKDHIHRQQQYKTRKYEQQQLSSKAYSKDNTHHKINSKSKGKENYSQNKQYPYDLFQNSVTMTKSVSLNNNQSQQSTYNCKKLTKKQQKKGLQILKKCLKLLASRYQDFSHQITYKQLLQKIVVTGQIYGENMRDISFQISQQQQQPSQYYKSYFEQQSYSQQQLKATCHKKIISPSQHIHNYTNSDNLTQNSTVSLPFQRYNDRIKQKFTKSGQHYQQFMRYLNELN